MASNDDAQKQEQTERMRHSAAHVMAEAVGEMFPGTKYGIGPTIEDGFYYDFDLPRALAPEDLAAIEARMRQIIAADLPFAREEVDKEKARQLFASQPYKLELIGDLEDSQISTYTQDSWTDLCRGPHVERTGQIGAVKLLSVAGAYWRGDERRPMLQRIYGTAWATQEELDNHLQRLAEAERRDHRKLGKELDLYSITPEVGMGLVLYHPKGAIIRGIMEDYWRQRHRQEGYDFVYTPHIGRSHLWEQSGHLNWYKDGMYAPIEIENEQYYLKPMNCPFHMTIYKSRLRSYRELPLRLAELGTVYRYERSGVVQGLLRVRGFTQDDAHIFSQPERMRDEIVRALDLCLSILRDYGFNDVSIELSVRDPKNLEKYAGSDENWRFAEAALANALESRGLGFTRMEGEAVFYGPKIDFRIKDALGRTWQASTIQFDFNLPERFDLTYVGEDGREHRPYMVHRALYGAIERFLALLIEHYAGALPLWLSPVQAIVIPIADRHADYAASVEAALKAEGLRVEVDSRSERMNAKIRDAQLQKIPYMLIVGDKEAQAGAVSVRKRSGEDLGPRPLAEFISMAKAEVQAKA